MLSSHVQLRAALASSARLNTKRHRIGSLGSLSSVIFALICSLIIILAAGCSESPQAELSTEERHLYDWIKTQADLVREHKSDCQAMARALVEAQARRSTQIRAWRAAGLGTELSKRLLKRPLERQELTFILEHTSDLYAHCAHQRSFRVHLEELWSSSE